MNPSIYNDKRFGINQADISKNALSIISRLHKNGFDAFIVGGGIRDLIKGLGQKILILSPTANLRRLEDYLKTQELLDVVSNLFTLHFLMK